mmetsp:Transcript_59356/g.173600  ORF Transcript_59356/g.173600 Transcript_59356/m.173600 type:complete len:248 (+) Transcript_59356:217-960(+)
MTVAWASGSSPDRSAREPASNCHLSANCSGVMPPAAGLDQDPAARVPTAPAVSRLRPVAARVLARDVAKCWAGAFSGGRPEAPSLAAALATEEEKPQNFPNTSCVSWPGANSCITRARTGGCSLRSTSSAVGLDARPHLSRKAISSAGSGAARPYCGCCTGAGAAYRSAAKAGAEGWLLPWPVNTVFAKARSFALTLRVLPRGSNCSRTLVRASSGSDSMSGTQLASRPQRTTNSAMRGSAAVAAAA